MGLILKDKIIYRLSQEYSKCEQAVLITAYLTSGIFDILGNLEIIHDKKIILFVRENKQDFLNGSICIQTLYRLYDSGIQCFLLKNLHAKLYIFDEKTMFIGSANLTNNGLSISPNSNIEILYQCPYSQEIREQVKIMLHEAIPLTKKLLNAISIELQEAPNNIIVPTMNENWTCLPYPYFNNKVELGLIHLPLCNLDYLTDFLKKEEFYHDQFFFGLRNDGNFDLELFKNSVLHRFIITVLEEETEHFVRFGTLKRILINKCHLPLEEKEIKTLVQNIYSYYKKISNTLDGEINYSIPSYTEVLSLNVL